MSPRQNPESVIHPAVVVGSNHSKILFMTPSLSSPVNYTLKSSHGVLGRISLFKPSYKLGEDITGTFDLALATVACLQVGTALKSRHELTSDSTFPHRLAPPTVLSGPAVSGGGGEGEPTALGFSELCDHPPRPSHRVLSQHLPDPLCSARSSQCHPVLPDLHRFVASAGTHFEYYLVKWGGGGAKVECC